MENQNLPIEMWNINRHRNRPNSAVEGWNSKLNSIKGKQQYKNGKKKQTWYLRN